MKLLEEMFEIQARLFNPRQTMRILPLARALRFPRVFQNFQPVNAKVYSDYIARAPNATEKAW